MTHALLAALPLMLVAATILTVHLLGRALLLAAWIAAALCGARPAARMLKTMLAARRRAGLLLRY